MLQNLLSDDESSSSSDTEGPPEIRTSSRKVGYSCNRLSQ